MMHMEITRQETSSDMHGGGALVDPDLETNPQPGAEWGMF
jgi:hypothetical protein